MGTWNAKPFGNDAAGDWLWILEKAGDESVIKAALESDCEGETTIAAAAVVEAARRQPLEKLPTEAKRWVAERGLVPTDALVRQAIAAVEKIKTSSELRDLWAESKHLANWLEQMDLLLAGLREVLTLPLPSRKPKAPASPRLLHKLIEQIAPDEESPRREKLRLRLEAVEDVNALIKGTVMKNNLLCLLAAQGLVPEARRLIERGAKAKPPSKTHNDPLVAACAQGHAEMAKLLIEHGAEIYREVTIGKRSPEGHLEKQVIRQPTALLGAVQSGSIATVELLLAHGSEISSVDDTPHPLFSHCHNLLHKAVESNQLAMVDFLFKKGVDLETKTNFGFTPLLLAVNMSAHYERNQMVEKLLSLGANSNARDNDGVTALDMASSAIYPDAEIIRLIKTSGGLRGKEIFT